VIELPDFSGLTRKTIQKGLDGMILTVERDEVVFAAVKDGIDQAYLSGTEVNKSSRKPYLYVTGVLLALALLIFAGIWATPHFPTLSVPANKSVFSDGAPNWEQTIITDTPTQAAVDPVVSDVKAKTGTAWTFVGDAQYKDYLYFRTVNMTDNTKVRILVYHWTLIGGWQYFDQQDI
jgi:hypothetical protein